MSKVKVDYDSLEQSKQRINIGQSQSSSIASKISSVKGSIDSRVASRCGDLDSLITYFNNCAQKLANFSGNVDTTIFMLKQLENGMDFDYAMQISALLKQLIEGENTEDILQQLESNEKMLEMVTGTLEALKEGIKEKELTIEELEKQLQEKYSELLTAGYADFLIESNPEYLELQRQLTEERENQKKLQIDLSQLNNLKVLLDYQNQDFHYQINAKESEDFYQNNGFESILNEDGTIKQEVMDAINAYRRENNLMEITSKEEFLWIFGEITEEEWLERAALTYDVFSAVNPLMVASAVNKNGYETGVDIDNYLLADTYFTEEEKATYNYYYNKLGREKADEFLDFKLGEIKERKKQEEIKLHQETYQQYLNLGKNGNYDESLLTYYNRILNLPEYLTEEEKNTAIYLYKTEGLDKYDEFIKFLDSDLKQREAKEKADEAIEDFVNSGVFKNVKIGATGLSDGVLNFFEGLKNATIVGADGEASINQLKSQYILESLMTDERFIPYLDSGTYEISMGIGNMTPSMVTSALVSTITTNPVLGAKVGSALMGISSGGNSYENALMSGAAQSNALLYGILSGASDATLEYFLGNIPGLSKMDSKTLFGLLKEGGEESAQEILDSVIRYSILGEEFNPDASDILKSGVYGFITAGILNGASTLLPNSISSNLISSPLSEDSKMIFKEIEKIDYLSFEKEKIDYLSNLIHQLPSEYLQIEAFKKLPYKFYTDDFIITDILETFSNSVKVGSLSIISDDYSKMNVINSLSDDYSKIRGIFSLDSPLMKASAIKNLSNDELKLQMLKTLNKSTLRYIVEDEFNFSEINKYKNIIDYGNHYLNGEMLQTLKQSFSALSESDIEQLKGKTKFVPLNLTKKYDSGAVGYNNFKNSYVGIELGSKKYWISNYFAFTTDPSKLLKSTIIHENLHELCSLKSTDYSKSGLEVDRKNIGLDEVATEYLTQVAMGSNYPKNAYNSYYPATKRLKQLIDNNVFTNEILQDAYFNHKPEELEKIINNKIGNNYDKKYESGFDEFTHLMDKAYKGNIIGLKKLDKFIVKLIN